MDADGHGPMEDAEHRCSRGPALAMTVEVPQFQFLAGGGFQFLGVWVYIVESLMHLWLCSGMVSSGCLRWSWKNSTDLLRAARAACTWTLGYFSELVSGRHLARCLRASPRLLLEEFQSCGCSCSALVGFWTNFQYFLPEGEPGSCG